MKISRKPRLRALLAATGLCLGVLGAGAGSTSAFAQAKTPWPGGIWSPGPASYNTAQDLQTSVTMSDGVILKADISYPVDPVTGIRLPGPFPVLLTQTPYLGTPATQGDYFVQRGYIFVTAYVRGSTTSGGQFSFFSTRDAQDGAELVKWSATQVQNSNGVVGLWGGSYGGLNQVYTMAALGAGSPVKGMVTTCMGAEFYRETYFASGIPTQTFNFPSSLQAAIGGNSGPVGAALVANIASGGDEAYYGAFWAFRTPGNYAQQLVDTGVPVLLWSSNGDIYTQSSLDFYAYLQNGYAKQPIFGPMNASITPTGRYQIVMGQGGHCANQDQRIELEWFDTWLKNVKTNMDQTTTPLHAEELVSNRWLSTSVYPVVPTYSKLYLDRYGALATTAPFAAGQESLFWAQPTASSTAQYDSDVFPAGATLAGPISASVYASSNSSNLELIASLQLVGSDGTVLPLTSGTVLGSLGHNDPQRSWVDSVGTPVRPYQTDDVDRYIPANSITKYDFLISPRFVHIPPGSKLRIVFSTQTPTASCGGALGTDPCYPTVPQNASLGGSRFVIYHGDVYGSSINLPLLPATCWKSSFNPSNPTIPIWNNTSMTVNGGSPCQP